MAEIIDFRKKVENLNYSEEPIDKELEDTQIMSREIFSTALEVLDDLGYDPMSNPKLIRDIEALSFISTSIIYRFFNNPHPGTELLKVAQKVLTAILEEAEKDTKAQLEEEFSVALNASNDN